MSLHTSSAFSVRAALQAVFHDSFRATTVIHEGRRNFHEYFVTHLPSSSLSPDKPHKAPDHRLPRDQSKPHSGHTTRSALQPLQIRDTTIVRIPIRSAKHHFGAANSRGSRPYNEDTDQAGTIEIPAFAKRQPKSITNSNADQIDEVQGAENEAGDPQVFYFGVFDGHGGGECSEFLRERLHGYVEEAALIFGMESSLTGTPDDQNEFSESNGGVMGEQDAEDLQKDLVQSWKETVGGYFKRFRPEWFPALSGDPNPSIENNSIETILTYAFLKADLDFITAQAVKHTETKTAKQSSSSVDDPVLSDRPLNDNDLLFHPERPASQNLSRSRSSRLSSTPDLTAPIGGTTRFKGGSTASIAMISTPTPTPFWHPAAMSTLVVAHVGDTRIILCRVADGKPLAVTNNHHPDAPIEAKRLRRYAATFVTDSFGEERIGGLANTRAFGDIGSKRMGVSAEPQITKIQINPTEFSFVVLVSDGVSGHLEDQEIVDVVKDAKTPSQAAKDLVNFAVEVSREGDNATAQVIRLGGWERRLEGGNGSLGTKEQRDFRKSEAMNPRSRRQ